MKIRLILKMLKNEISDSYRRNYNLIFCFSLDIDRCVATGATKEKVEKNMLKHLSFIWKD